LSLTRGESVLAQLQTLKGASVEEQVRTIESLAMRNLDLYDALAAIVRPQPDDSIFELVLRGDREQLVRAAMLSIVASDIGTVPYALGRKAHIGDLEALCQDLGLNYRRDVYSLLKHQSDFERLFARRTV